MKTILIAFVISLVIATDSFAQTDTTKIEYRAFIASDVFISKTRVEINQTLDSALQIRQKITGGKSGQHALYSLLSVPIGQINTINIYRKNNVGRGMGKGALIGLGVGALGGLVAGALESKGGFIYFGPGGGALIGGLTGCLAGTVLGGLLGSGSLVKIPLNKKQDNYIKYRSIISPYSITGF